MDKGYGAPPEAPPEGNEPQQEDENVPEFGSVLSRCIMHGSFYDEEDTEQFLAAIKAIEDNGYTFVKKLKSGSMGVVLWLKDEDKDIVMKLPPQNARIKFDKLVAADKEKDETKYGMVLREYTLGQRNFEVEVKMTKALVAQLTSNATASNATASKENSDAYLAAPNVTQLDDVEAVISDFVFYENQIARDVQDWMRKEGSYSNKLSQAEIDTAVVNLDKVITNAFKALDYLHDLGFMHLDFAPRNTMNTATLIPKLIDFGVTCEVGPDGKAEEWASDRLTFTGIFNNFVGSPTLATDYFQKRMYIIQCYAHILGMQESEMNGTVYQANNMSDAERLKSALSAIKQIAEARITLNSKDPAVIVKKSIEKYERYIETFDFSQCKTRDEFKSIERAAFELRKQSVAPDHPDKQDVTQAVKGAGSQSQDPNAVGSDVTAVGAGPDRVPDESAEKGKAQTVAEAASESKKNLPVWTHEGKGQGLASTTSEEATENRDAAKKIEPDVEKPGPH